MSWYFDETWYSSDVFDYELLSITNTKVPPAAGLFTFNGLNETTPSPNGDQYTSEIVVRRLGEATAPVEVLVSFADGSTRVFQWDGKERWTRFTLQSDVTVTSAIVDPYRKLLLDVNWNNNSKVVTSTTSMAGLKWGLRFLFWVQSYLDIATPW